MAVGSWLLIHKTRVGMLIRAGAQNPQLVSALGVNIGLLNALLFGVGAMLVVIVIVGIGSVSGAFYASLIVGVMDTLGRVFLPLLRQLTERSITDAAGPALAAGRHQIQARN